MAWRGVARVSRGTQLVTPNALFLGKLAAPLVADHFKGRSALGVAPRVALGRPQGGFGVPLGWLGGDVIQGAAAPVRCLFQ